MRRAAAPEAHPGVGSRRLLRKSAVITGAAKGIGRATAELFASEGARIVVGDIGGDALSRLRERLESSGAEFAAVVGYVSKPEDAKSMVEAAVDRYGRVGGLVGDAGVIPLPTIGGA